MNRSRVTGDLASHGNIFVDIANDRVGIGSTIPTHKVDLDGSFKLHDGSGFDNHITYTQNPPTITFPSGSVSNLGKTPTLVFGDRTSGGDFKIYQDFYSLHMRHLGPSGFHIGSQASHIQISGSNGSNAVQPSIRIDAGANEGVKLYSGGTQRFETVGYGITVLGTTETQGLNVTGISTFSTVGVGSTAVVFDNSHKMTFGSAHELEMYHDGSNSYIKQRFHAYPSALNIISENSQLNLMSGSGGNQHGGYENAITCHNNSHVKLYYGGTLSLQTTGYGAEVIGSLLINMGQLRIQDEIRHDGDSDTKIRFPTNDTISFETAGSERLRIDSGGIVTVNYGNPTSNGILKIGKDSNGEAQLRFETASANTASIVLGTDEQLFFKYGGTEVLRIDPSSNLILTSADAGSSAGPEFKLFRNSASPANADYLGQIKFAGESSTGVERNYAKITGKILDVTNGSEDGILEFAHIKAGSQTITGRWRSDSLQLLNGTSLTVAGTAEVTGNTDFNGTYNEFSGRLTVATHTHFNFGSNNDNYITQGSSGNTYFRTASTLFLQINSSGHLLPYTDSTYDLGTSSKRFRNLYADYLVGDGSSISNVNATTLDSIDSGSFLRSDADDTLTGDLTLNGRLIANEGSPPATGYNHFISDDGSATTLGTAATLRVANNGGNAAYSVLEAESGSGSIRLANDGQFYVTGNAKFSNRVRTDIDSTVDGFMGEAYNTYFGLKHTDQTLNSEYMIISKDFDTFISASTGSTVRLRSGGNDSTNELIVGSGNDALTWRGNKVFHAGNDGSGSGLDADTLDGIQSTAFIRTSGSSIVLASDSNNYPRITHNQGSAQLGLFRGTNSVGGMYIGADVNSFRIWTDNFTARLTLTQAGSVSTSVQGTLWGASNDGSGSGLDADLLDGVQGSSFLRSDADDTMSEKLTFTQNGQTEFLKTPGNVTMHSVNSGDNALILRGLGQLRFQDGSDWNYNEWAGIKFVTSSDVMYIGGPASSQFTNNGGAANINVNFVGVNNNGIQNNGNTVWHAGNDGSGSGLDADLLDGLHASSFCRTDTTFTFNGSGNDINIDYDNNRNLVRIQRSGSERFMLGASGNEIKINTSNGGFLTFGTSLLPQNDNSVDLGSSSKRWANLYTADAHFNNVGTGGNDIDGTEGSWTLQEAEDNIYMINRKNGKRYKIKMEEV